MIKKHYNKVITIGEILADFVPEGRAHRLRPGGAPSNVAVNLARAGIKSGIISKVGDDFLGSYLVSFLKKNEVDVSQVKKARRCRTGLVFVFLDRNKERDFTFYGDPPADQLLNVSEINQSFIKRAGILHFGSISMMAPVSGRATLKAIKEAKKAGLLVSYDPNLRLNLWQGNFSGAKKEINRYFKYADIIKISDTELKFLRNAPVSAGAVKRTFGCGKFVAVSMGEKGCFVSSGGFSGFFPGIKVKAVDTTGAGDAFMAGILAGIAGKNKGLNLTNEDIKEIAAIANKMGAKAVTKKGAV